ncbi:hypothetical protein GOAMR_55_00005, partial [Gordonia amarae NBRC 15530]
TGDGAVAGAAAPGGATGASDPQVLSRVQLGPLDVTTLTGGDLTGLQKWLSGNGYQLKPAVSAALAPYVSERWSFVAIKLTSRAALSGPLDPIRMVFNSGKLVYPMRMSVAATGPQLVDLYVIADHRQLRSDADVPEQPGAHRLRRTPRRRPLLDHRADDHRRSAKHFVRLRLRRRPRRLPLSAGHLPGLRCEDPRRHGGAVPGGRRHDRPGDRLCRSCRRDPSTNLISWTFRATRRVAGNSPRGNDQSNNLAESSRFRSPVLVL